MSNDICEVVFPEISAVIRQTREMVISLDVGRGNSNRRVVRLVIRQVQILML